MNHNVIFDTLVNHQTKDSYERVEDIRRGLSEKEEALIRSQAIVMIDRNQGRQHIVEKVLKRFKRCINV
tara:strand:+ start:4528 stop:4734 length:207 start_codon:yes stop_codon:yes gene_type:complete